MRKIGRVAILLHLPTKSKEAEKKKKCVRVSLDLGLGFVRFFF